LPSWDRRRGRRPDRLPLADRQLCLRRRSAGRLDPPERIECEAPDPCPALNTSKIVSIGLFTGQIGYAWNNTLFYVKGGAAATHDKYRGFNDNGTFKDQASETRWGGAVGTGVEYGFAPNWSVGVEYDHLFMGNRDVTLVSNSGVSRVDTIRQDVDMGTVRLNYRFGGPMLAKF
jgi:outer membrane immunogenic protein